MRVHRFNIGRSPNENPLAGVFKATGGLKAAGGLMRKAQNPVGANFLAGV